MLIVPRRQFLDNIALQDVIYCCHNGEKKVINKVQKTNITLKIVGLYFKSQKKNPAVCKYSFLNRQKGTHEEDWQTRSHVGIRRQVPESKQLAW